VAAIDHDTGQEDNRKQESFRFVSSAKGFEIAKMQREKVKNCRNIKFLFPADVCFWIIEFSFALIAFTIPVHVFLLLRTFFVPKWGA